MDKFHQVVEKFSLASIDVERLLLRQGAVDSHVYIQILPFAPGCNPLVLRALEQEFEFARRFRNDKLIGPISFQRSPRPGLLLRNCVRGRALSDVPRAEFSPGVLAAILASGADVLARFHEYCAESNEPPVHRRLSLNQFIVGFGGESRLFNLGLGALTLEQVKRLPATRFVDVPSDFLDYGHRLELDDVLQLGRIARELLPRARLTHTHPLSRLVGQACEPEPARRLRTCADFRAGVVACCRPATAEEMRAFGSSLRASSTRDDEPTGDLATTYVRPSSLPPQVEDLTATVINDLDMTAIWRSVER
jgi:hypothetical protein